jgi:hypothetical protein
VRDILQPRRTFIFRNPVKTSLGTYILKYIHSVGASGVCKLDAWEFRGISVGKITEIDSFSGHCKPTQKNLYNAAFLKSELKNGFADDIKVSDIQSKN